MDRLGYGFAECQRESGVSKYTWRRLADAGLIRTINIGARRLVPREEWDRIRAHGVGTPRARKASSGGSQ
jgi:hypothetical protein